VKRDRFLLTPFFIDEPSEGLEPIAGPDWQINKPALPTGTTQQRLAALHEPIAAFVADSLSQGRRPVSIAGDCCTAVGVVAGLRRAGITPTVVWLDAHGDFNTWETTPSGFLGGMPLAMLAGRGEQTLLDALGLRPIAESDVVLSDGRDLDPQEREALRSSGVHHVDDIRLLLDDTRTLGPMYVHFDTDVVDAREAPAMSYPAVGGPTSEILHEVFDGLAATGRIVAVSMCAWNPRLDNDGRSRSISMDLLHRLLAGVPDRAAGMRGGILP
jgi:arginase